YKLLLGGIFGGLIIYFTVKAIPNLGVSNTLILTLVSQVLVGFFIDSVILGQETMHLYKYIGVILLILGTFFIVN
ncbi:DMT family transporter, partial [Clostridioides difficile]